MPPCHDLSRTHADPAALDELAALVRMLAARGWSPATGGNFSRRLGADRLAITISGRDKSRLTANDLMQVDLDGHAVDSTARPSAEMLLHTQLYARFPEVGCVLHTHSQAQTVASRLYAPQGHVRFSGYELLKAFAGISTHETHLDLPVLPNSQDMPRLAAEVERLLDAGPLHGYLIEGHGLYAWGRDPAEATRHLEAFDFLIGCELAMRTLT
jgi:methylthioribulose-1-phosphate dehydratase